MKSAQVVVILAAVCLTSIVSDCCLASEPTPLQSVRPMIGTSAHGHVFPGATVPFGMVQLSPDTRIETWDGCSGYHYSDKTILGFSHTHLSGTGCPDLGDIRVIPLSGDLQAVKKKAHLAQPFSHADETAKPGYYEVLLGDSKIKVELTATAHAGFHRYTFPADRPACLVFDLDRGIGSQTEESVATVESDTVIVGYRHSHGWAADKTYYFVAEFSQPFDTIEARIDGKTNFVKLNPANVQRDINTKDKAANDHEVKGKGLWVGANFKKADKPILVKVGISAVSVEAARKNLMAEIPTWDFAATIAAAEKSWNDVLDKITIQTADPAVRETFYSALYHMAMAPTLFNDVDGSYRGLDHKVHSAANFQNYCTFSLWDTFRAEHPLLTIIQPQRVSDFINTMLAHYREFNQHALPVWSLAGNETWCMIGNHAIPVIVDAYAKGFRGFDAEAIYAAMRDAVMQDRAFMGEYSKYGYVLTLANKKDQKQSVSRTLEYAYDDSCMAKMAAMLGKKDDAVMFAKRAENWRNVFDPSTGFARGKTAEGKWCDPFNPCELIWADYTEATGWEYTWFVPQNIPGLVKAMNGDEKFVTKLDGLFTASSEVLAACPDITGLIGQYAHGNEPCHHVAYLYSYAGAPWKTQECIRKVMADLYNNTVEGLCGNDDCGQMSAWYVLSALGLYPVNPASGVYVIGSPVVDRATIHLDAKYHQGETFTIIAENNSPKNVYIQSATLNGKPLTRTWLKHAEIVGGGELTLKMGPEPNKTWGKLPEDRPR
jgi:predicted alpha-1,2-mannosidase